MSRNLDTTFATALSAAGLRPIILAMLTFKSATRYVWSGVGDFAWGGHTFTGVGDLGEIGNISESSEVKADGTSVTLSGINNTDLAEAMNDIQPGLPAKIWYGALDLNGQVIGTPYLQFSGEIDKASCNIGDEHSSISLALESRMNNHARASNRRYTAADQNANGHPTDSAFDSVEALNDQANPWGH